MKNLRVLLINPALKVAAYSDSYIRAVAPQYPPLNLAAIAAPLLDSGCDVKIIDLDGGYFPDFSIEKALSDFRPRYVGISVITPAYHSALQLAQSVKAFDKNVAVVAGGAHATALPEDILKSGIIDIAVRGEGDFALKEIIESFPDLRRVKGIVFKKAGRLIFNQSREQIINLDDLPYPAWQLYDLRGYRNAKVMSRDNPCGLIETSRGCPYGCVFCNKGIFGRLFRVKSAERVVNEIERMLRLGFKEIHISDDCFSGDLIRAKRICDLIVERRLNFPWNLVNGIRVDRADRELFYKLKRAGCYRVAFGIESGNQKILDRNCKGIILDQARRAVGMARQEGLETLGFFIIGLPGETEESIRETIKFSKSLDLDWAKFNFLIPYPGSPIYEEWEKAGCLKSKNWAYFVSHRVPEEIYDHPFIPWPQLKKYYRQTYRAFYLRPGFIARRFMNGILSGAIFSDIKYFFQTRW